MALPGVLLLLALLLNLWNEAGSSARATTIAQCVGYVVDGAGSADFDGCYTQNGTYEGRPTYFKDATHQLYDYQRRWKLGLAGKYCSYQAAFQSDWPPESPGGCGDWSIGPWNKGQGPCPSVRRSGLPPVPPAPPAPPAPPVPPAPPAPPMHIVFEDTFDGPNIDSSKWKVQESLNRGGIYRRNNTAVENGALVMRTVAENYTYGGLPYWVSSGAVSTSVNFSQRLGRWEASVKLPRPNESPSYTLHSSIWLNSGYDGAAHPSKTCADEIDVVEQYVGPRRPSPVSMGAGSLHMHDAACVHTPAYPQGSDEVWSLDGDYTSKWTVFRLDWTDTWISMAVDNKTVATFTNASLVRSFTDVQPLILTATVMERVPTLPSDVFPQEYWVDWVRIYAWD